jgi:hypothetical protein
MNLRLGLVAVTAVGLSALAMSTPAGAQAAYGSAAFGTYRDCSAAGAGSCDGTGPGQVIAGSAISGGTSSTSNTTLTLDGLANKTLFGQPVTLPTDPVASVTGIVSFGASDLPILNASSASGASERMGINAFGYQSYTNTGAVATPFQITGNLNIDSFSGTDGGIFAGGAVATSYVGVWDPSIISSLGTPDAQTLFDSVFLAGCGTSGVLSAVNGGGALVNGVSSPAPTISTTTGSCSGSTETAGALMLAPGQTVLVVAGLQLLTNRGGALDAMHTFTTEFTPDAGVDVADLRSGESLLGVPEPATWAMMIVGFFGLGGLIRRRKAALAV